MPRPFSAVCCTLVLLLVMLVAAPAVPQSGPAAKHFSAISSQTTGAPLLPETFAGWQRQGPLHASKSAQNADATEAAVLNEYGFVQFADATYTRGNEHATVKAIQFGDATGAYGAFTFYRRPGMMEENIGQGAAFDGTRVLFWSGTVLVDASFSRITPMTASELRDLASELPTPVGNQGILPRLPEYLPPQHLERETIQYAVGPLAYQQSGGVLPAPLVDFQRSAEVVTAQYNALNGMGTLTIINYPTPEIAMDRLNAVQAYFAAHGEPQQQLPWTPALMNSNPEGIRCRRSGPLLAVTSGSFSADVAQQLLESVHYEVNMTMGSSARATSDTVKLAQIILDVAILVGVFALIAIIAGVSLGGGRVLWRNLRTKSGKPVEESAEFIRLNLKE